MPANVRIIDKDGNPRGLYISNRGAIAIADYVALSNAEGKGFYIMGSIHDLDANHSFDVLLQTGSKVVWLDSLEGLVSGASHGYMYEDTIIDTLDSEITILCANRVSCTGPTVKAYGGSTETSGQVITDVGTQIMDYHFPASGKQSIGGESSAKLLLKPHTNYLIRMDNEEVTDIEVTVHMVWIEL